MSGADTVDSTPGLSSRSDAYVLRPSISSYPHQSPLACSQTLRSSISARSTVLLTENFATTYLGSIPGSDTKLVDYWSGSPARPWTNSKSSRRFLRMGEEFGNVLSFPQECGM